ncbi:hypothetical protein [Coralliovum pocilloporae]|uniref:hypothetical protein n=1 Tax=Coralliovum pocilloporae TaxID=3066369 RepID=UPI003306EB4A
MCVVRLGREIGCDELGERVFSGEIVILTELQSVKALSDWARLALKEAFSPHDPRDAENHLDGESFNRIVGEVAKRFRTDEDVSRLYRGMFEELGYDPSDVYEDIRKLRRQPSNQALWSWRVRALPAHRDGWATNIAQQINWWAPIYDIQEATTVLFYPYYWDTPIANDSGDWDFDELMRRVRSGDRSDYPLLPTVTEEPDASSVLPLDIRPGEIVAFSGYHLHASAVNTTGRTRFNFETRTVSRSDRNKAGAPNVDGAAPRLGHSLFRSVATEQMLEPSMMEPDDLCVV